MKMIFGLILPLVAMTASSAFAGEWIDETKAVKKQSSFFLSVEDQGPAAPLFIHSKPRDILVVSVQPADIKKAVVTISVKGATKADAAFYLSKTKTEYGRHGLDVVLPAKEMSCHHKNESGFHGIDKSGVTDGGASYSFRFGLQLGDDTNYMQGACVESIVIYYPKDTNGVLVSQNGKLLVYKDNTISSLGGEEQANFLLALPGTDAEKIADIKDWVVASKGVRMVMYPNAFGKLVEKMTDEDSKLALIEAMGPVLIGPGDFWVQVGKQFFPNDPVRADKVTAIFKKIRGR